MIDRAKSLIEEINQIKEQYFKEVGQGRRAWPRAIKDRIRELEELGLTAKVIALETGISYQTIILWRHQRRKQGLVKSDFHTLKVATTRAQTKTMEISKSLDVTLNNFEMPTKPSAAYGALSLQTPKGFIIGGLNEQGVLSFLAHLSKGDQNAF